jgi:hypothetical protein
MYVLISGVDMLAYVDGLSIDSDSASGGLKKAYFAMA